MTQVKNEIDAYDDKLVDLRGGKKELIGHESVAFLICDFFFHISST